MTIDVATGSRSLNLQFSPVTRRISRRTLAASLLGALLPFPSRAEYPDRPLKIVVAWPPGGVIDVMARFIAENLREQIKQGVVVENLTGANGNIGTARVAQAVADGYTLQAVTAETHAINPHLYDTLRYDVFRDFDPIALLAQSNFVLITKSTLPPGNLQDFIAMARASPGKLSVASYGIGSTSHVTMASFEEATQTSFLHVPYRGVGPVVNALLTQEVDAAFVTPFIVMGHQKEGRIKILGAASRQRMAIVPDAPTFTEQGVDGFVGGNWYGIVGPHGIAEAEKTRLASELQKIASTPQFETQAKLLGINPEYLGPEAFANFLKKENERWGTVIRARNITIR